MTTSTSTATTIRPVDRDRVIATLVTAFSADPVIRWVFPDSGRYLAHFPELVHLLGGEAFGAGSVGWTADYGGAALWVPPGASSDDEAMVDLLQRSIDVERHDVAMAFLGQVNEHHPADAIWYLPFIGVDPSCQGRGHGSMLLEEGLARCDADDVSAYLEASSPRNRALYERHGFTVTGEIRVADSPPLWPMMRTPR